MIQEPRTDPTTSEIQLHFEDPLAWVTREGVPCIFDVEIAKRRGVYLWTVPSRLGELIYYVGETGRSFSLRMFEHLKAHLSGSYHVHDPDAWQEGEKVELWPGFYDPVRRPTPAELARRYRDLAVPIARLVELYRFHVAATEMDDRLRLRAEAAIAHHLYAQADIVGRAQDRGIRYCPRLPSEEPVELRITSSCPLLGLPQVLEA